VHLENKSGALPRKDQYAQAFLFLRYFTLSWQEKPAPEQRKTCAKLKPSENIMADAPQAIRKR
jgi:hypothetical protein